MNAPAFTLPDLDGTPCHVAWRDEDGRKVPYSPRTGRKAMGKHSEWGGTYKAASALAKRIGGHVGMVLGTRFRDYRLLGIDLDGCRDSEFSTITPWARKLIHRFATYTEISPSGTGVKLFMLTPESDWQAMGKVSGNFKREGGKGEKAPGIEIYSEARYFTVTDDRLPNSPKKLAIVTGDEFRWVAEVAGPEFKGEPSRRKEGKADVVEHNKTLAFDGNLDRLREALDFIKAEDHSRYKDWLDIVSAIHHESRGSDEGLELAIKWSDDCIDYQGDYSNFEDELRKKWPGFGKGSGRHLTGAYLLKLAFAEGFSFTQLDFEDLGPLEQEQESEPRKRSTLRVHYVSDLKSLPPFKHLIRDTISIGALSALIGAPGVGKTFIALDMLLHIATGKPWFGKAVVRGSVIIVALEGARGMWKRIRAWCERHGVDPETLPIVVIDGSLNLRKDKIARQEIIDAARQLAERTGLPVRAIVIDTLNRAMFGGNESASEDMGALIAGADHIRIATGGNVMLVHHLGKDDTRGARGHSSLFGAVDTELTVDEKGKLKITKQKEGEDGTHFAFRLEQVDLGDDDEGNPVTSQVVVRDSRLTFDDLEEGMSEHEKAALQTLRRMIIVAKAIDGERDVALNEFRARIENSLFREKRDSARRMAWKRLIDSPKFLEHVEIDGERIKCAQ